MSPITGLLPGRPAESLRPGYAGIVTTPPDEPVRYTEIRALPQHRPRRHRVGLGGDAGQFDAGVLEHFLQPLDRARALLGLGAAQPGQVAQTADLGWRHEARTQGLSDSLCRQGLT